MPEIARFFGIVIYMNWREQKRTLKPIDPLE